jgi:uncharacterized MAPEG superfamily protein
LRTQFIISVIALVMTTGCARRPPAVDFEKEFLQEKAKYEPNIGKSFWLVGSRSLCPTTTTSIIDCTSIPPGTKLQLNGIERGINSNAYYYVTLEDGRTGYIFAFDLVAFITDVDPALAVAECKRRGNPRVGMTRNQSPWAQRMMAAHVNAVENLVIFAPLVLTARALSITTAATAFACALYFWSRLAHVVVYTFGIPVLRTLSFVGGFVAEVLLVLAIFKLI